MWDEFTSNLFNSNSFNEGLSVFYEGTLSVPYEDPSSV